MTAKDKAKELMDSFEGALCNSVPMAGDPYFPETKQCAQIAVDEILRSNMWHSQVEYWQQVKEEINKL